MKQIMKIGTCHEDQRHKQRARNEPHPQFCIVLQKSDLRKMSKLSSKFEELATAMVPCLIITVDRHYRCSPWLYLSRDGQA